MKEPTFPGEEVPSKEIIHTIASQEDSSKEESEGYKIQHKDGSIQMVKNKKEEMEARRTFNENQG